MKNETILRVIGTLMEEEPEYVIRSDSLIFLNIFDELLEIHSDVETGEYQAENPYMLNTLNEIFNYVLIRTSLIKGWLPNHINKSCSLDQLRDSEILHLTRLADNRNVSAREILNFLLYCPGSPQEAQKLTNEKFPVRIIFHSLEEKKNLEGISHKLVKAIRAQNRKIIIAKVIKQVQNSKD